MKKIKGAALCVALLVILPGVSFAQFTLVDVKCEADATTCPAGLTPGQFATQTAPHGINARGDIVGVYVAGGQQHGFLRSDGRFTSLDFPVANVRATAANGINPQGEIVGQYVLPVKVNDEEGNPLPEDSPLYCPPDLQPPSGTGPDPACTKAFYYARGKYTTLTFPDTVDPDGTVHKHPGAIAQRITPDGDIYGCIHEHNTGSSMYGAAWTRDYQRSQPVITAAFSLTANGGELTDSMAGMAMPMSMNNGGTVGGGLIVGFMVNMTNRQHGFLVRNGSLEFYDPTLTTNLTGIWDVNASGQFVGTYRVAGEVPAKRHGFLQNPDGSAPVSFDVSFTDATGNVVTAFSTIAYGINPDGVVVGQYVLVAGGPAHGFLAIPGGTE